MYGQNYKSMILELNASDDRGIQVVREQIKNFASTKRLFSTGFKLIVLDEADAMTNVSILIQVAQAALRRVIEQYTKNVRFCMICNYVGKIIPALQSRCTRFRFAPLGNAQIQDRLNHVVRCEGIMIDDAGMQAVLKSSFGDMRRALNIMQVLKTNLVCACVKQNADGECYLRDYRCPSTRRYAVYPQGALESAILRVFPFSVDVVRFKGVCAHRRDYQCFRAYYEVTLINVDLKCRQRCVCLSRRSLRMWRLILRQGRLI
jgi:DNA polymerase III delta prime subunit